MARKKPTMPIFRVKNIKFGKNKFKMPKLPKIKVGRVKI